MTHELHYAGWINGAKFEVSGGARRIRSVDGVQVLELEGATPDFPRLLWQVRHRSACIFYQLQINIKR